MLINTENFKIDSIYSGETKKENTVTNRKKSSLFLRISGSVRYIFSDCTIDSNAGDIVFVPKGSSYSYKTLCDEPCRFVAIRFEDDVLKTTPCKYPPETLPDAEEFETGITELWKFGGVAEHYRCYSLVYNLLYCIKLTDASSRSNKAKHNIISPAIAYLKEHIYSCKLKIDTLHKLCGVSDTYFRKIFHSKYGMSPQKYVLAKRLSHAKVLIDSGDFDSISEVANQTGFGDPLYFSRMFKKYYGISPSKYAQE